MLLLDPQADEKALWVQAKRGVLAILRVQPAQDLVESLMCTVTEEDELRWEIIVAEMDNEPVNRRMPSTTGAESGYRLEDIRSYVCEFSSLERNAEQIPDFNSRKSRHTLYSFFSS